MILLREFTRQWPQESPDISFLVSSSKQPKDKAPLSSLICREGIDGLMSWQSGVSRWPHSFCHSLPMWGCALSKVGWLLHWLAYVMGHNWIQEPEATDGRDLMTWTLKKSKALPEESIWWRRRIQHEGTSVSSVGDKRGDAETDAGRV